MLHIKPFRQTTGFCGPVSLKMVLEYFGVSKTERELAKLSGAKKNRGVSAEGLCKAAKHLGFHAFIKDFADFSNIKKYVIKKKIPVIVDWFSQDEGHYSAVVGIDRKNIFLMDPEFGRVRKIKLEVFKRVWFDFSGKFMRSKKDLILRRMIVFYP